MTFQSTSGYTIAGTAAITLQSPGGNAQITVQAGSHSISVPLVLASDMAVTATQSSGLSIGGVISGNHSLSLSGSGTLTLSASNAYGGGTSIKGGRLVIGISNALPATTLLTLGDTASAGTIDLVGHYQTISGLGVASGATASSQVVSNSNTGATATLEVAGGTNASTFGGMIENATNLLVSSGTLTLTGSNIYTGGTSVTGGLLEINSAGALPSGTSLTIGSGGGAVFDAGGSAGEQSFTPAAMERPARASFANAASVPSTVPGVSGNAGLSPVPEPGTCDLLVAGAIGLIGWAWRRRAAKG